MNESSQLSSKPQSRDDGSVTALDCAVIVAFITVLVVTAVGVMSQQANAMLGDAGPRSSNAIATTQQPWVAGR
jgi:Flp pilus assembly pilin Flp